MELRLTSISRVIHGKMYTVYFLAYYSEGRLVCPAEINLVSVLNYATQEVLVITKKWLYEGGWSETVENFVRKNLGGRHVRTETVQRQRIKTES